jgi:hypothetical protein
VEKSAESKKSKRFLLTVTANFTAEPVGDTLRFWLDRIGLQPAQLQFSPYNQVFQELMAPDSLLASSETGVNLLLIRPEEWAREQPAGTRSEAIATATQEFISAMQAFTKHARRSTVVLLCPPSQEALADKTLNATLAKLETEVVSGLGALRGVHIIRAQDVAASYPVEAIDDPENNRQAHIPFTAA